MSHTQMGLGTSGRWHQGRVESEDSSMVESHRAPDFSQPRATPSRTDSLLTSQISCEECQDPQTFPASRPASPSNSHPNSRSIPAYNSLYRGPHNAFSDYDTPQSIPRHMPKAIPILGCTNQINNKDYSELGYTLNSSPPSAAIEDITSLSSKSGQHSASSHHPVLPVRTGRPCGLRDEVSYIRQPETDHEDIPTSTNCDVTMTELPKISSVTSTLRELCEHLVRYPDLAEEFFQNSDVIVQLLKTKFEDDFASAAISCALDSLDRAIRLPDQQSQRRRPALPKTIGVDMGTAVETDADSKTFLRISLHRNSCDPVTFEHGAGISPGFELVDNAAGESQSLPENLLKSPGLEALTGLGSHFTQEHTKQAAPGTTPANPSVVSSSRMSSSKRPSKGETTSRRRPNDQRDDSEADDNGTPKRQKSGKSNSQKGPQTFSYACPVHKYELTEQSTTRICLSACYASNMSQVRRHLRTHKDWDKVKICKQCYGHVLNQAEWDGQHGDGRCPVNSQPRGIVNVCRQWAALYRKMYPHATRIPDPRNGVDVDGTWRAVQPLITQEQDDETASDDSKLDQDSSFQSSEQPEFVTTSNVPGESHGPTHQLLPDAIIEASQTTTKTPANQSSYKDRTFTFDQVAASANAAMIMIKKFTEDFRKHTDCLSPVRMEEFTREVRHEFYRRLREQGFYDGTFPPPAPNLLPTEQVNSKFQYEAMSVAHRTLPWWEESCLAIHMNAYFRGLRDRDSLELNDQMPMSQYAASQQADIRQEHAAQESVQDSAYGTGPDPANRSDTSKELQRGPESGPFETIDPRLLLDS